MQRCAVVIEPHLSPLIYDAFTPIGADDAVLDAIIAIPTHCGVDRIDNVLTIIGMQALEETFVGGFEL